MSHRQSSAGGSVGQPRSAQPQLNVFKTAIALIVFYFIGAGILGAVLSAVGIPLHPVGLLALWIASSALVAKRITRRFADQPPMRLCVISLLLSIAIYAMIAIAVGLRADTGLSLALAFQMTFFAAVMMMAGLFSFHTVFRLDYGR